MNLEREDAFSWRQLASENLLKIDYNVLSVAAMTLALLLVVEFIRHRLDDAAQSRPFFRAVLEGVYAECTFRQCCSYHIPSIIDVLALLLSRSFV